jgi:hypothetical protein
MTYWRTPRMSASAKQSSVYRLRMIKTALNGALTARVADSAKAIIALLVCAKDHKLFIIRDNQVDRPELGRDELARAQIGSWRKDFGARRQVGKRPTTFDRGRANRA